MTYDTRGNRASTAITTHGETPTTATTTYTWTPQIMLASVTLPDSSVHSYAYDYRVRRITRSEGSANPVAMTFSGGLSVAEFEVTDSQLNTLNSQPSVEYQRGPDMGGGVGGLLYSLRSGTPKFNLSNGRGDVVAQSDSSGDLTWTASYDAFGKRPVETGTNADRQRANTKEEDPTGLNNEGHRMRELETGVWLSRDPAGFVDGPNLYAYVQQNPWTMWDPDGLKGNGPTTQTGVRHRPPLRVVNPLESNHGRPPGTPSWVHPRSDNWYGPNGRGEDVRPSAGGFYVRTNLTGEVRFVRGEVYGEVTSYPGTPRYRDGVVVVPGKPHGSLEGGLVSKVTPTATAKSEGDGGEETEPQASTDGAGAKKGGGKGSGTGTVWDSVKDTQPLYEGTQIPKSFELTTEHGKVWVHGNATEHLAEYATSMLNHGVGPMMVNTLTQIQISSLQAAVGKAIANGVPKEMVNVGGWELGFGTKPLKPGESPVLKHALRKEQ